MRETVTIVHRDQKGLPDYVIVLTFGYEVEAGKWVGACLELGTPAFSETFEQVREELHEAVELQLNELERLTQVEDFLQENRVHVAHLAPRATPQGTGFAVISTPR